jgi:hypothetical protein
MARRLGRSARLLLAAAVVLAALLAVLALTEFSSPALGRALLARAGAAAGVRLEADTFRLSLLRGFSLGTVRASGSYPGGRYELGADRLVFEHRLRSLLAGRLTVDRIRLVRPRVVLTEGGAASPSSASASAAAAAGMTVALQVVEAAIEDGAIEMRARGRAPIAVRGLDLRLRDLALGAGGGSALRRLSGTGRFHADEIALPVTRAREVEGTLRLAGGRLQADEVRFATDEGRFQTRWSADLDRLPFTYALAVEGRPLDLNHIAGASARGARFGPAHLTLDGTGVGPEAAGLTGKGVLRLEAGSLPTTPFVAAVERAIGRTGLAGARYQASETPFRVERGRVLVDRFRLDSEAIGLEASGSAGVDGALDLAVAVRTPRSAVRIAEVPPAVLDALTDAEGWVRIPLRVTGTREAPRVTPDAAALLADARRAGGKALASEAMERLKGLLK